MLVMQSAFYQATDNRDEARDSLYSALDNDFKCYEAFNNLTSRHMISKIEGWALC